MHRDGANRGLIWGVGATLLLPVVLAVVSALGALLAALGDTWGAAACQRTGLVAGGLWIVAVVATTALNAIAMLEHRGRRRRRRRRRHMPSAPHSGPASLLADDPRDRPA